MTLGWVEEHLDPPIPHEGPEPTEEEELDSVSPHSCPVCQAVCDHDPRQTWKELRMLPR